MGRTLVILVDTHVVMWMALEADRIARDANAAIDEARRNGEGLAIADITLLELARLASEGRIDLYPGVEAFLREVESRFAVMPMSARACVRAMGLPSTFPKDPADRIIVGTALVEGMALITADREIRRSKVVRTIW
jgi:PIN domain nuclease of toxin-antitoxin system